MGHVNKALYAKADDTSIFNKLGVTPPGLVTPLEDSNRCVTSTNGSNQFPGCCPNGFKTYGGTWDAFRGLGTVNFPALSAYFLEAAAPPRKPNTDTLALGLGLGLGLGIPIVAGMVCLFTRGQYSFGRGRSMLSGNAASFNDDRGQGQPSSTATRAAQSNTMRTPQPNTNPMSQPQPRSQTGGYTDSGAGSLRASHNAL